MGIGSFLGGAAGYVRPYWKGLLLAVVATLPSVALETVQPLLMMTLIDAIAAANHHLVWLAAGAFIGLIPVYVLGNFTSHYVAARIGARVANDLRMAIFERLQDLSISDDRRRRGDLLSRFTSDLDAVERAVVSELPFAVSCILTIVIGLAFMFAVAWQLAVVLCVCLPITSLAPRLLGARTDRANDQRQQDAARVVTAIEENLAVQPLVKVFGLRKVTVASFQGHLTTLLRSTVRASLLSCLRGGSMNAGGSILLMGAVGGGAILTVRGTLSIGGLVAVIELLWFVVASLEALADVVPPLQRATSGMQRIQDILHDRPDIVDAPNAQTLPPFSRDIVFRGVGFSYGQRAVLEKVNFRIKAGESVLVVGPSGAGKSTLVSLLLRLHDPASGAILVDGHDLRRVTQASLHSQIGVVFQDPFLLEGSFRENIRLGKLDATDDEIEAAARDAEIHDDIVSLAGGYDALVGERGGNLSVGQRQRVALARALVRKPAILILDEPASALDQRTEAAINATLRRLSKGRTVLSVSHRLASAAHVDRILVVAGGTVVEDGTHERLVGAGGVYAGLWDGHATERQPRPVLIDAPTFAWDEEPAAFTPDAGRPN